MSELRQDRTTGAWVIVAPRRSERPKTHELGERPPKRPRFDPACPFCPGNEFQLPAIVAETPAQNAPGWSVRVVPNMYPALELQARASAFSGAHARPGYGVHEVIIESPRHDSEPATAALDELNVLVEVYRERSRKLLAQHGVAAAILFHNHGPQSGASLVHAHAQIVALDFVPPRVAAESAWGSRYYEEHGRCGMCDELAIERKDIVRVIEENDGFVALVPRAAEHPYEIWIVPKQHQASFTRLCDNMLREFAALLGRSLRRLTIALGDPSYNFVVDTASKSECTAPYRHWKLRIVPDVAIWGGFELGGGLPINPSSPENDARVLRSVSLG